MTLVVLAGGRSRRMGFDKAEATLAGEGMLARMLANLAGSFAEVVVAGGRGKGASRSRQPSAVSYQPSEEGGARGGTSDEERGKREERQRGRGEGVRVVEDEFPGAGPLAGIHAGLRESRTEWNFCVACDMPLLAKDVAERLLAHTGDFAGVQAVVPVLARGLEPLAGLYRRDGVSAVEKVIRAGGRRIVWALADLRVALVGEEEFEKAEDWFFNVNTPAELEEAERRLRARR
ncbi:MAG: molybdenum cofactor guanylyltransferase [Planctomycetota bacterium]